MKALLRLVVRLLLPWDGVRDDLGKLRADLDQLICGVYHHLVSRNTLSRVTGTHLLLNFGAGNTAPLAQWICVDIQRSKNHFWADLRDPLPLPDACARHVHCEHFLEHLPYDYAKRFLAECHRILEPGGSLRIIVPDAGKYLTAYCHRDTAFFERLAGIGNPSAPLRTPIEIINQSFRMGGAHLFSWDFDTLEMVLKEAGFYTIEKSDFGKTKITYNIDGIDEWRRHESLYLNAEKYRGDESGAEGI